MTDNTTLDAAIEAACKEVNIGRADGFHEFDRTYARALIAKLLEGMEPEAAPLQKELDEAWDYGFLAALTEIRRRAGLEVES